MAANWMKTRQTKYWTYAGTYIVVILAVLVAVNFLANRYDKSYDSTANKQFSLSDQTIKVVRDLKSDVHAHLLRLPRQLSRRPRPAGPLLRTVAQISCRLHRPGSQSRTLAKAAGYRPDAPIMIDSGTRKEAAKSLSEEEVTGAHHPLAQIRRAQRLLSSTPPVNTAIDDEDASGFSFLKQLLERDNYTVKTDRRSSRRAPEASKPLAIGQAPAAASVEIPKDCTVLVVGGPQLDYSAGRRGRLQELTSRSGGRALIMLDNVAADRATSESGRRERRARQGPLRLGRHRQQGPGARSQRHRRIARRLGPEVPDDSAPTNRTPSPSL